MILYNYFNFYMPYLYIYICVCVCVCTICMCVYILFNWCFFLFHLKLQRDKYLITKNIFANKSPESEFVQDILVDD